MSEKDTEEREDRELFVSRGFHDDALDGMCVMEMVSVLAGEGFSDNPDCVDARLCAIAVRVNDLVDDNTRQLLLPLVSRLMNTNFGNKSADWNEILDELGIGRDDYVFAYNTVRNFVIPGAGDIRKWETGVGKSYGTQYEQMIERLVLVLNAFDKVNNRESKPLSDKDIQTILKAMKSYEREQVSK